jgi:hypothetical protein
MKFIDSRLFADPEAAAKKLMKIASGIEPVQDGRIFIELINWPFLHDLRGTPAEYKGGLDLAIARGWLWKHESGTYVKITQKGWSCLHDRLSSSDCYYSRDFLACQYSQLGDPPARRKPQRRPRLC